MGQQVAPPSEPTGQTPPSGTPPAGDDPFAGIQTEGRTVAEIEAEYRARLGGHQRGWNAAEKALREELETLRKAGASSGTGQSGGPDASNAEIVELRQRVEQAERARTAAERRAKYPGLAAQFPDNKVFEALDDADLAKLNATLEENLGGGTFIAPTSPRRAATTPAQPKPIAERSKQELLADLARLAPQVMEQERTARG